MTTNNAWNSENPAQVSRGSTGLSSATAYAVLCGGTTSTADLQSIASVGSSNQSLVSNGAGALPTFQNQPVGDWSLISTGTASDSASIEFNNLSSTHFLFLIVCHNVVPATNTDNFQMRTSTDNGLNFDASAGNYAYVNRIFKASGTHIDFDSASATEIVFVGSGSDTMGNASNETYDGNVWLYNPSSTAYTRVVYTGVFTSADSASEDALFGGGHRASAADVDAIQFLMSSGNITSGIFKLYGLSAA